jgi:hypothetical protein
MTGGIQIGLQAEAVSVAKGQPVALRALVRNGTGHRVQIEGRFGLVIQKGAGTEEERGGPKSGVPLILKPGEALELAGWRLTEGTSQEAGEYSCWVSYRPEGGEEIRSNVLRIRVQP